MVKKEEWAKPLEEREPKVSLEIVFEGHFIDIHRAIQMIRNLNYSNLKKVTFKRPKKINEK